MIQNIKYWVFALLLIATSCAKKIVEGGDKLPKVKDKDLVAVVDSVSLKRPDFFYTKISTKYKDTLQRASFKTSVRIKADSAVHSIITFARIPIINAVVTKDTVTITNKKDKCYIQNTLDYFKESFGVNFKLKNIEELIMGLPLNYDPELKYVQINDPYHYIISSHNKREIRRTEKGRTDDDIIIQYFIDPNLRDVQATLIESVVDSTVIKVNYLTRQMEAGYNFPKEVKIQIDSPRNHIEIEMEYDKIEVDEPREIFIVIPEEYEKCD